MKTFIVGIVVITLIGLTGCPRQGTGEKTGERIDEVIDNVEHGDPPFKQKGTMEKMGEFLDDSLKDTQKK